MMTDTEYSEQQIIGSILIDPNSISLIRHTLKPEHFGMDKYREIYEAMLKCEHADIVSVGWKLHETGKLQKDSRSIMLLAIAETVTSMDLKYYADAVIKYAAQRYIDYYNKRGETEKAQKVMRKVFGSEIRGAIKKETHDSLAYPDKPCQKCGADSWAMLPNAKGYYCVNCEPEKAVSQNPQDYSPE